MRNVVDAPTTRRRQPRRLGELLVRHSEIIHPGDRKNGEATFVGLEHIEPNTGRRIGSLTIDLGKLTGRKPTFRRGQIVYGYLRPYLNKVWIADFDGCSSVDQFAFDVRQDLADTAFIAAFMRSETFLRRSEVVTTTGQLPRISVDEIAAVPIELPPVAEQRRITAELNESLAAVDAARLAAKSRLAAAESLSAAYLREVFNSDQASEWPTVKFETLVNSFDGLRVPVRREDRQDGPYPYYGASGVIDAVDRFLFDGEYLLIAEDGANLVARSTPIAFVARGRFWVNNHAHVVHPRTRRLWTSSCTILRGRTFPTLFPDRPNPS